VILHIYCRSDTRPFSPLNRGFELSATKFNDDVRVNLVDVPVGLSICCKDPRSPDRSALKVQRVRMQGRGRPLAKEPTVNNLSRKGVDLCYSPFMSLHHSGISSQLQTLTSIEKNLSLLEMTCKCECMNEYERILQPIFDAIRGYHNMSQ
jgi:hypothetical protein